MDNSLWQFSLQHYARANVANVCLDMQERFCCNTNILLWALWLSQQGKLLTLDILQQALLEIEGWQQDYVLPLRQMRQKLKASLLTAESPDESKQELRQSILQAELLAERQVLARLYEFSLSQKWPESKARSQYGCDNLRLCLEFYGVGNDLDGVLQSLSVDSD